jgi:hypothetical protein
MRGLDEKQDWIVSYISTEGSSSELIGICIPGAFAEQAKFPPWGSSTVTILHVALD